MRWFGLRFIIVCWLVPVTPACSSTAQDSALGSVDFRTSAMPAAQAAFLRGVQNLHSFMYDDAAEAFQEAARIEPGFAMAYWGEAMSLNHPLWAEQDLSGARQALARLAPTADARQAKAPTAREKGWLAAIDVLYGDGDKLTRDIAYSDAMRRLHEQYPADAEVTCFFALSRLGTVRQGDKGFDRQLEAADLARGVFVKRPDHPGAAHYLIHALDDPGHASLALDAAFAYARIAPASPHALHMPSHIFVQLGMWKEAVASNTAAYGASVEWAKRKGLSPGRRDFHSLSWLQYANLQRGDIAAAKECIDMAVPVANELADPRTRVADTLATMVARFVIETQQWQKIPLQPEAAHQEPADSNHVGGEHMNHLTDVNAAVLIAAGISAAKNADMTTAAEAERRLRLLEAQRRTSGAGSGAYSAKLAAIMADEVAAIAHQARGETGDALRFAASAAATEETLDSPSGPPEPIKPAQELYGEVLLANGQPHEAATQFEKALVRMPNRSLSLLGAARAAAAAGNVATARLRYATLLQVWTEAGDAPGVREARAFVAGR